MNLKRLSLFVAVAAVLVAAGIWGAKLWRHHARYVSTDDAYVRADIARVTARIPGTIVELAAEENWQVTPGTLLARLDDAEPQVRLARAEAALALAREHVEQLRAAVLSAESQARASDAEVAQAKLDLERAERLTQTQVAPQQRLDRARISLRGAEARRDAARRDAERARAVLGSPLDGKAAEAASVREAKAARDEAALLVSYTEIRAPKAGIVARRSVEVGQRVEPGQPLLWIVPIEDVYVEANFKETQLEHMRVGQPATVTADAYPGVVFQGRVASLAPGSGSAFALLPPENASGNWVKVVQRVPVRIALEEPPAAHPLRISLSVVATVDVRDTTGSLLTPLSQTQAAAAK